jgi:hypothetical protein
LVGKLRPRLTYANVLATIAVFAALGGGAYAATTFIGPDGTIKGCVSKKSGALRVVEPGKKCSKKAKALVWSERGPRGDTGPQGTTGPQGSEGSQGIPGEPGTARAYAYVEIPNCAGTPTICPPFRSKGVSEIRRTSLGTYCVTVPGISANTVTPSVAVAAGGGTAQPLGNATAAHLPTSSPVASAGCGANSDFVVETEFQPPTVVRNAAGDGTQSVAGNAVPSNSVSFIIVIP